MSEREGRSRRQAALSAALLLLLLLVGAWFLFPRGAAPLAVTDAEPAGRVADTPLPQQATLAGAPGSEPARGEKPRGEGSLPPSAGDAPATNSFQLVLFRSDVDDAALPKARVPLEVTM